MQYQIALKKELVYIGTVLMRGGFKGKEGFYDRILIHSLVKERHTSAVANKSKGNERKTVRWSVTLQNVPNVRVRNE